MSVSVFTYLFLAFFILEWLIHWGLDVLNKKEIQNHPKVPDFFKEKITTEAYDKSRQYSFANLNFDIWSRCISGVLTLIILFSGILPYIHEHVAGISHSHLLQGILFFFSVMFLLEILKAPISLYHTFVLEEKFGFNKSTFKLYLVDTLKSTALSLVIGAPLLGALLWFLENSGQNWWVYAFILIVAFQMLMLIIYPIFLAPLFNKFKPLEEGELKTRLMALAKKANFSAQDIYVMDGSRRSAHSNAYFTGFGKFRRIVLYDTLVNQLTVDELESVLAHEMGHYKKGHIYKMLGTSILFMGIGLFVFSKAIEWPVLYRTFGFTGDVNEIKYVGLFLASIIFPSFIFLLSPLMKYRSRKQEFEADAFAKEQRGDSETLENALLKLAEKNLSNLTPHAWYSAYHYSHPSLFERIQALKNA